MVTGDREDNAQTVGAVIGVDDVLAERTPAEKVDAVKLEKRAGSTIMVGDGINDAPALALADVGVAVGARGATASSEAADVVLTVDRLDRLGEAVVIARRARRIAYESVVVGMGLSLAAMVVAACGYLPPVWGAILQELIDVAVILNALRALRDTTSASRLTPDEAEIAQRFSVEHATLRPYLARIRAVADSLDASRPAESLAMLHEVHRFLVDELEPHEEAEDSTLYPTLARVLGGNDPTATMSRAHVEISHLIRRIGRVLDDLDPAGPDEDDIIELRRLLYGLYAVLQLHFAQEDEGYLSLADETQAVISSSPEHSQRNPRGTPDVTFRRVGSTARSWVSSRPVARFEDDHGRLGRPPAGIAVELRFDRDASAATADHAPPPRPRRARTGRACWPARRTTASGCASRLSHHEGWPSSQPFIASTTRFGPSSR